MARLTQRVNIIFGGTRQHKLSINKRLHSGRERSPYFRETPDLRQVAVSSDVWLSAFQRGF